VDPAASIAAEDAAVEKLPSEANGNSPRRTGHGAIFDGRSRSSGDDSDAEGNYLLHGAWRYFDEQGRLVLDGLFERDQKTGLWRRFYRGHETKLLTTAPYKDFAPPFISEATFQAGRLHGTWTMTDRQQRKVHEIALVAGQRQGTATWFHPSGAALLRATYDGGIPSGHETTFASDGSIALQENYQTAASRARVE
jgi:antitoxin component YwqK of YwqJK toxin-antitoxin module